LIENVDDGLKVWEKTSWRVWRNLILIPLVAFFCFSVMLIGPQFKVNNIWAVIPDGYPATMIDLSQLLGRGPGGVRWTSGLKNSPGLALVLTIHWHPTIWSPVRFDWSVCIKLFDGPAK